MILCILAAAIGTYGISYICSLVSGTAFSNSIFSVFVFGGLFCLWKMTAAQQKKTEEPKERKRRCLYGGVAAYLFALTMVFGYQIKITGMTECGFRGKGLILLRAFCLAAAVFPITYALFARLGDMQESLSKSGRGQTGQGEAGQNKNWSSKRVFFVCWGIIFACFIPVFLAYYPAVMAYDFHRQSQEATFGPPYFNSHHPLAHTWLIWLFFEIGGFLGSLESGMACYSIFQMLLVSAALAYACTMIYRLCRNKWALAAVTAFFALFPYFPILAVSVTKDVIFGALFLIFFLLLTERMYFAERRHKNLLDAAIVLEGIVMLLFRNNAIYAVFAFAVFFVLFSKGKERLRVLLMCVLILAGGKASLEGLQAVMGELGRGSSAEMYSVVMQQFARVGHYHREELDAETYALLDTYVSEEFWDNYNPPIADTVKIFVSAEDYETWEADMGGMWKAWAAIGRKYPNEYLDAFLCLTNGYWFWDDVTWAENLGYGLEERKGALFTFNSTVSDVLPEGIDHVSKFPWLERQLEEIVSNNSFYRVPVLSNLFKPALYCHLLVLSCMAFVFLRKKKAFLLALLPLMYLGTLLFGPVVIVRYLLPVMLTVPVLLALLSAGETEGKEKGL